MICIDGRNCFLSIFQKHNGIWSCRENFFFKPNFVQCEDTAVIVVQTQVVVSCKIQWCWTEAAWRRIRALLEMALVGQEVKPIQSLCLFWDYLSICDCTKFSWWTSGILYFISFPGIVGAEKFKRTWILTICQSLVPSSFSHLELYHLAADDFLTGVQYFWHLLWENNSFISCIVQTELTACYLIWSQMCKNKEMLFPFAYLFI